MAMYLEHFGLREAPFRITPHTEFFFAGANRGATLEGLLYAITAGEGLVKVTGEVGSGKTMLCRVLIERLPASVETIYLAVPSLTRDEMLASIAADLGIDAAGASTHKIVRALQERLIALHAEGRHVVALIDEAHAMPLATLEEIRLLSNLETGTRKLLQVVLFGQPELDTHLAAPHMRQLKERITHSFALAPLPPRDIKEYVDFRMRAAGYRGPDLFGPEVLRVIADGSEGLTRRINIYADKTLLAAFAAGTHTLTADHARAAVADTQIVVARRGSPSRLAIAAAAGLRWASSQATWARSSGDRRRRRRRCSRPCGSRPCPLRWPRRLPRLRMPRPRQPSPLPRTRGCKSRLRSRGARRQRRTIRDPADGGGRARARVPGDVSRGCRALAAGRKSVPRRNRKSRCPAHRRALRPLRAKAEAADALATLPVSMRQFGPYVRRSTPCATSLAASSGASLPGASHPPDFGRNFGEFRLRFRGRGAIKIAAVAFVRKTIT
jgi:type II secretory pathway predicted ATPase ExeA